MAWEQDLLPFSLNGIEFPVARRNISGGNDFARARYQGVAGQDLEWAGQLARVFSLQVELFADVNPDHYPGLYRELHDMLMDEDLRGEVEYSDAVWGPIQVGIFAFNIDEGADARDGARVTLEIEEAATEVVQFVDGSFKDPRAAARSFAQDFDLGIVAAGITEEQISAGWEDIGFPDDSLNFPEVFLTATDELFDLFTAGRVALADIAFEMERYRHRVDKILNFDPMREATNWEAYYFGTLMVDSAQKVADGEIGDDEASLEGPQFVEYTPPEDQSAEEISLILYGNIDLAADIIKRNPTNNPLFYPAGEPLTVKAVTF